MPFASGPRASAGTSLGRAVWAASHAWAHLSKRSVPRAYWGLNVPGGGGVPFQRRKCPPAPGGTLPDFAVCQGVGREGGWGADFQPHTLQRPVPSEDSCKLVHVAQFARGDPSITSSAGGPTVAVDCTGPSTLPSSREAVLAAKADKYADVSASPL
jgi:hypothetical protein